MNEMGSRLNLIQRAMQRGALSREAVSVDESVVKQEGRPQSLVPEPAPTISPPPSVSLLEAELAQIARAAAAPVRFDDAKLRTARIVTPDDRSSATYNEFRSLKRKLLPMTRDPATGLMTRNVVMVTSALPTEGKTFTVMNLGICLAAERDLDVIIVDSDVVRGSIGHFFDGEQEESDGLVDILTEKCRRIEDVLHPCADLPRLHVLFAGNRHQAVPELLASPRMAHTCDALSKRFQQSIVLFDTPPVLAASESAALATHADHIIMVVGSGQSTRNQVEAALTEVSSCRNISLLFNRSPQWQRPLSGPSYYYGEALDRSQKA